jgi:dTDP-4-dehydrorhamnose 3,5-epimerase
VLNVTQTEIQDVFILEYDQRHDPRGSVFPNYSKRELEAHGLVAEFVEEYLYCPSKKGTLYGIHFQNHPKAQTKVIACTQGRGLDYTIDLRPTSPTYKQWVCVELSPENRRQMYIPKGCGHAFVTVEDQTHIIYRIDEYADPALQRAITYTDPDLNIPFDVEHPVLSEQDANAPYFKDSDCNY